MWEILYFLHKDGDENHQVHQVGIQIEQKKCQKGGQADAGNEKFEGGRLSLKMSN